MFSRKLLVSVFLTLVSCVVFAQSVSKPLPPVFLMGEEPDQPAQGQDGQYHSQLGVGFNEYWTNNEFFINKLAQNERLLGNPWGADAVSEEFLIESNLYDPSLNGGTFYGVPSAPNTNNASIVLGFITNDSAETGQQDFVLTWEGGDATFQIQPSSITSTSSRRIEFSVPQGHDTFVRLRSVEGSISNIKVFLAEHEDNLNNGEIFNPDFVEYARGYDVLRHMDSLKTNQMRFTKASDLSLDLDKLNQGVFSIASIFELAKVTDNAVWINIPTNIGATDAVKQINSGVEMRTYGQSNAEAILSSPEWKRLTDNIVAMMNLYNYPQDMPIYVEYSNEIWNNAAPFGFNTNYVRGIGAELFPSVNFAYREAYGYISAMIADYFQQSLQEAGRENQTWSQVIAVHTHNPSSSSKAFVGIDRYKADVSDSVPSERYGVATTGYYSNAMEYQNRAFTIGSSAAGLSESAWLSAFVNMAESNPATLSAGVRDFYLSNQGHGINLKQIFDATDGHKAVAEENGAFYLGQYEGSSHEALYRGVDNDRLNNSAYMTFRNEWLRSTYNAEVVRTHNTTFREKYPDAMISNFGGLGSMGSSENHGPWIEMRSYDDTSPVIEAWSEILD